MTVQILRRGRPRKGEGRIDELMRKGLSRYEAASESRRLHRAEYLRRRRERDPEFRERERRAVRRSYQKKGPAIAPAPVLSGRCFNCGRRQCGSAFQKIERNVLVIGEIVPTKVLWCGRC